MKPITREQKEVAKLATSLRPISQDIINKMALMSHFEHKVSVMEKHKNWCVFRTFIVDAIQHKRYKKCPKNWIVQYHPNRSDLPLDRRIKCMDLFNDLLPDYYSVGTPEFTYKIHYVTEQWWNIETGKIVCRSTRIGFMGYGWSHWSNFEIRNIFKSSYGYDNRWDYLNIGDKIIIRSRPTELKGKKGEEIRTMYFHAAYMISDNHDQIGRNMEEKRKKARAKKFDEYPVKEFLEKGNQIELMDYYMNLNKPQDIDPFVTAIKIANRHHYVVKNAYTWTDMVKAMNEIGADTHNPKLVCPDNIWQMHDKYINMAVKFREKMRKIKEKEEMEQYEKEYQRRVNKYKDVMINVPGTDLIIFPCMTVKDMYDEGEAMHHCVYRMKYYLKVNTLILFCRNKANDHIATIEINTKQKSICQVRALCNTTSPFDEEIRQSVYENMSYICSGKPKSVCAA